MNYTDIGNGEVIVFLHGLGNNKHLWDSQLELSSKYRLVIPDLRGHGDFQTTENITVENMAKDIIELLDELDIKEANICGLSLGGIVAQEIYRQNRNKVKRLILCNTASYVPYFFGKMIVQKQMEVIEKMDKEEFKKVAVKHCIANSDDEELVQKVMNGFEIHTDSYIKASNAPLGKNYLYMLPFITKPMLIVGGKKDKVIPMFSAYQTYFMSPYAKLVLFEDAGHISNIEKKEEFNEMILEFLS